ncbi:UDP-N-acetylmuramate--L-alanine ligase [Fulvivirga sp. M361]|uniref:UDP-N-acetylmuramate--L-alanine ligase n=1 Tax=Fulvivirga sp. M361 TaxID=2594266 RepID=UPI00117BA809|nr:UDP-N-acetylmuramate--L-alanine ligase [Fulvivirga sp. M361]TRX54268.1 UDP-N-acetylmuramate--L-alanine ligase [Fulvivirga sp. M361]
MNIREYDSAYFIGIGGIGMSALARWFNANGYFVAGYDRTSTPLTQQLTAEGIDIHYDDDVALIPKTVFNTKCLIVITPAIPKDHKELNHLSAADLPMYKRSQVLGMISSSFTTVAVAGTHGKTTTSSMVAHILKSAGKDITAFLGGIATNYDSNFIENKDNNAIAVVEADEFDRSFLTLHPDIAVITSVDADHLDIYGDEDSLKNSFKQFISQIKNNGRLFVTEKVASAITDNTNSKLISTYGLNRGQFFASNITIADGFFIFNYCDEQCKIEKITLGVPGFHNVENVTAAIAVALELGVSADDIKTGVASYRGVKRRFEFVLRSDKVVFIDDYAHHPTEIESFLTSLKALYPGKKITVIFQPHLFTRTRDFVDEFAVSLGLADEIILLDIYPAREEQIEGVTSAMILDKILIENKICISKDGLMDFLDTKELEVVATIGAGDIDQLVAPLKENLERRYHVA